MTGAETSEERIGPEILPGTPEYAVVERIVAAVERSTGRTSRWNRRLHEDTKAGHSGAIPDGLMLLDRQGVLDPLRRAGNPTPPLTPTEIEAVRRAVYIVVHEAIHHLSALGDGSAPDAAVQGSAEDIALEEALADTEAVQIEEEIVQDIGMHQTVPGIEGLYITSPTYVAETQTLDEVTRELSGITGESPGLIRATIHRTPRAQRFNAMADLVIDHRLRDLMPAAHQAQIRARLTEPLEARFRGEQPAVGVTGRLAEIETHYRSWHDANPDSAAEPPRMPMSAEEQAHVGDIEAYAAEQKIKATIADMQRYLGAFTGPGTSSTPAAATPATDRSVEAGVGPGGGAAGGGGGAAGGAAAAAAFGRVLPFRRPDAQSEPRSGR